MAAAIFGRITDPRKLGEFPPVSDPDRFAINDDNLVFPPDDPSTVDIIMGPNIKPFPKFGPLPDTLEGITVFKVEDNITTDHIMPAGTNVLPLRSNIEAISEFVFYRMDPEFPARARSTEIGIIVGGEELRPGLVARACSHCSSFPGHTRQTRQEFRKDSQG